MPTDAPQPLKASVVIVTRNRREMVRRAVASAVGQSGRPEVLVIDDASADGTAEAVRAEFPDVRVVRHDDRGGYIVRRSQGGRLATGDVLFSIDDDAVYADADVVSDTLAAFADPRVGAAMIPHVNRDDQDRPLWSTPLAPADGQTYVTGSFIGTAYAVRRQLFNDLGGYRDCLFHWGEETEFCQRLMDAGRFVVMGSRYRIHHYAQFAGKYEPGTLELIYRNRILTVGLDAPGALLPPLLCLQVAHAARQAWAGRWWLPLAGTRRGFADLVRLRRERRPVRLSTYLRWTRLRQGRCRPLSDLAPRPVPGN